MNRVEQLPSEEVPLPDWYTCPLPVDEEQTVTPPQKWKSSPLTPGATLLYFDPALALEIGETKAIILQKVWDWMEYNRIENKIDHLIDGQWYTYNSAKQWRDNNFWYLSVATVKKAFQQLEEEGYVQRIQYHKDLGDCRQWVTIPAAARARIDAISAANTPADTKTPRGEKNMTMGDKKYPSLGEKESPTKENLQKENLQNKNTKRNQQQPTAETDVVVVTPSHHEAEPESGEIIFDGEGHDTTAVKAFVPHEQHHDEHPISPVPQHPSSPALVAKLVNTLDFEPGFATTLIRLYGAGRVRAVAIYIESQGRKIHTPPAYMRSELERNELGLGSVESDAWDLDSAPITELSPLSTYAATIDYDAERIAELEEREHIPPLPEPVGLDEKPDGSMTAGAIWNTAYHQMKLLFSPYDFGMYLSEARLAGYDLETKTFRVRVRSALAQEMLQHRYYRNVQRIIEGLHNAPVNLVFEECPSLANPNQRPLTASELEELHRLRADHALV